MQNQNDFGYFKKVMDSLEKYKAHIDSDVRSLINETSPLGLFIQEMQANQVSSNSDASKRKRNTKFMLEMRRYAIEQSEIRALFNGYREERERQAELDEENDSRFREEKERIKRDEVNSRSWIVEESHLENEKIAKLMKELMSEILHCLQKLEKYIAQLEEFIIKLDNDIQEQRKLFLNQFHASVKETLIELCVKHGDHYEMEVGKNKITVDVESMARKITAVMEEEFNGPNLHDKEKFKSSVQKVVVDMLIQSSDVDLSNKVSGAEVEKVGKNISNIIDNKQSDICEAAVYVDKVQKQRSQWAHDLLNVCVQEQEKLRQLENERSAILTMRNPVPEMEKKMECVNEIKDRVVRLEGEADFSREERINSTLEALSSRKRRRAPAANDQVAPDAGVTSPTLKTG